MNHIHFLSDNLTVCQKPQRLGHDFVVLSTTPNNESCRPCSDLLFAFNLKEYEREQRSVVFHPPTQSEEDEGSLGKGITIGILLGAVLWFLIYLLVMGVI